MPLLAVAPLEAFAARLLSAAGTPEDIAARVAFSLVESNLKGVDSHGVGRLLQYLDEIARGEVAPAARPEPEADDGAMAILRGNGGFGIYALEQATTRAADKARRHHVAAVGLTGCSHTGRIGQFAEQAARRDLFCLILGGGAHKGWATVVPYGGARPIFSTNPYAFALPAAGRAPVVVDFATSAAARGKLGVYRARREPLPAGWIVDRDGRPSRDPEDLFAGGMQLPMAGHKGYGMGLIAELVCYAMLRRAAEGPQTLNWMVLAVDIGSFRPLADYRACCEELLGLVKATPPAPGFAEVLLPGEPEARSAAERRTSGIPVPEATWAAIVEAARSVGVDHDGVAQP